MTSLQFWFWYILISILIDSSFLLKCVLDTQQMLNKRWPPSPFFFQFSLNFLQVNFLYTVCLTDPYPFSILIEQTHLLAYFILAYLCFSWLCDYLELTLVKFFCTMSSNFPILKWDEGAGVFLVFFQLWVLTHSWVVKSIRQVTNNF